MKNRLLILFIIASLVLGACASPASTPAESEASTEATSDGGSDEMTADGPSGTLRYSLNTVLGTYNPWKAQAPVYISLYQMIYDGLITEDLDGDYVPLLATGWEYNDAQTELTITLRDDVVFHDGATFNAEAVKANLDYIRTDLEFPPMKNQLAAISSVDVVDEYTVKLTLSEPDLALISNLARNVGMMQSPESMADDSSVVGAGGWTLMADESIIDGKVVVEAFDDYWDPDAVGIQRFEYNQIPDNNARLNALLSGDLDIATVVGAQAQPARDAGFEVSEYLQVGFGLQIVDLNGDVVPQLADKDFRCGISQSINREAITENIFRGFPIPNVQGEVEGQYGYLENPPDVGFNPEAAAEKLAGNDGLVITTAAWGPFAGLAQGVAGGLAEQGITLEIAQIQSNQMWPVLAQAQHPIATVPYPEAHLVTAIRNRALTREMGFGAFNPSGYIPEGVADLYNEAAGLSLEDAEPLLEEIKNIMLDECIWIVAFTNIGAIAYDTNVVDGVVGRPGLPNTFQIRGFQRK